MKQSAIRLLFWSRVPRAIRAASVLLAFVSAVAFAIPRSEDLFFGAAFAGARSPESAARIAHFGFAAAALVSALVAIGWPQLTRMSAAATSTIAALPDASFTWLVVVLATSLRLAVGCFPSNVGASDPAWYHEAAASIAQGHGLSINGSLTAFRPPGYPYLLSLPYEWFGPDPSLAWIWGAISTAMLLLASYLIARRLYGKWVARMSTLGLAVFPSLALSAAVPSSDLPFTAILSVLLAWAVTREPYCWTSSMALGVVLGLATLIRTAGIAFVLVVPFTWFVTRPDPRRLARHFLLFVCCMAVPLSCWAARNYALFGSVTLATNSGLNILIGNHSGASGGYDTLNLFTDETHQALNEAQADALNFAKAINFVESQPLAWLMLLPRKLGHLIFDLELSPAQWLFADSGPSAAVKYSVYTASQLAYITLLGAFLVRVVSLSQRSERPRGLQWTGFVSGAAVVLVTLATFGQDRFRMPFLPWMMIEAAVAGQRLLCGVRET